ncbi:MULTISPECIES: hypothetical protein [unclassified Pseudomonas]|uniref:hypothetical protein n=1 Tax=unclassified Pseudomonas TaxID=196821 RepID=UPI003FA6B940
MRGVDNGVRQTVVAVEVFGFVAQRVDFSDEVALGVVAGFPGAAVGLIDKDGESGRKILTATPKLELLKNKIA